MMSFLRPLLAWLLLVGVALAGEAPLRVGVLDNSPPMAMMDIQGNRTGFSVGLMRALCAEMRVECVFSSLTLERTLDAVANAEVDVAAVNLLDTPERRARVLLSKPIFRSRSYWVAPQGMLPGRLDVLVGVVRGSAQEHFARQQTWNLLALSSNGELLAALADGRVQAVLAPMPTVLAMAQQTGFASMGLVPRVLDGSGLGGDVSFAISPRQPDIKLRLDEALDRIKRDGRYDRLNTAFLPFRID